MPAHHGFGRALDRDVLDTLLLDSALRHGVDVYQPHRASSLIHDRGRHALGIVADAGDTDTVAAPVLIAAHGSWEMGGLLTNVAKRHAPSDLLGFKAHFRGANLATGTMLLAFPGGYGGMVWAGDGRLSLSCCIRRDTLSAAPEASLAAWPRRYWRTWSRRAAV